MSPAWGQGAQPDDADEGSAHVEAPGGPAPIPRTPATGQPRPRPATPSGPPGTGAPPPGARPPAGTPSRPTTRRYPVDLGTRTGPGSTVQLGIDYLTYARQRLSPPALKKELESRLVPAVGRGPSPAVDAPFGKFEVRSLLGKGGMAEVFLAWDSESKADVALKVMRDDIATDPGYVKRFLREAANAGFIDHPNVVKVLEVGAVLGRLYFTMEALAGETLKERLARGPFEEVEGIQLLRQIAAGLNACHERGIGHRDMKPSNIMLATAGTKYGFDLRGEPVFQVKLMDFGLARQLQDDDDPELEAEGRILGTAKYVAPELVQGQRASLQSDLFSLGILAFQVFAGRAPFRAKEKVDYLEANLNQEAPPLDSLAPGASAEVATLVAGLLEKDPQARPTSSSLVRDLERLAKRSRPGEKVVVAEDPASLFYAKRPPRVSRKRAAREAKERTATPLAAVAAIIAIVLLLLVLVIVVQLTKETAVPDRPAPRVTDEPTAPRPPRPTPRPTSAPPAPSPAASSPAPPRDGSGLRPGVAPASLASLADTIPDASAREHYRRALLDGDRAWVDGRYTAARDFWRDALDLLGPTAELQARVFRAEREDALQRAADAESKGRIQEALDALEEAIAKGAPAASLETRRLALRARVADEESWKDALAESRALADQGDYDRARARLQEARDVAQRLGCEPDLDARIVALGSERKSGESLAQARALIEKARKFLDAGESDPASMALHSARILAPDAPGLALAEKRLAHVQKTPAGMVWLELDAATAKGLYVKKTAVTNRELKAWIDAAPPGKRRPGPWISGGFPDDQADDAVKGVRPEDAKAFAEARGERLPTADERALIEKALGTSDKESVVDARGTLGAGFRTVEDAAEEKP